MLLDLQALASHNMLPITGVLHVGAHLGEEAVSYHQLGIRKVIWVEANPEVLRKLKANIDPYGHELIHALITNKIQHEYVFHVTNYDGMSSSIFDWGTHTSFSPDTVHEQDITLLSTTIDKLAESHDFEGINLLNIDIEGAGLLALDGAQEVLKQIHYVYIEVQTEDVYHGAPLLPEYDMFLEAHGFDRRDLGLVDGQGWGDAWYVRRP